MQQRGWDELDILLISGDAYVDHPAFGTPLVARLLEGAGYRVGILAQPDWKNQAAFRTMGRPRLFAAISAGAMDSLVNHYTAAKKIRRDDAYTPGSRAGKRPNRAVIAYTAAVKGAFKGLPTVIGGIEASLRRLAHYDYWDDRVRRSVLIDSKADLLLYGMAETALLELVARLDAGEDFSEIRDIRGTAVISNEILAGWVPLPSFEEVSADPQAYNLAFKLTCEQQNPYSAKGLSQKHAQRQVLVNPPGLPLSEEQLDRVYALPFTRLPHPDYQEKIPAYEQIKFSVTSHRGCFGGCAFCAITHHQGKTIQSRSEASILNEVDRLTEHPEFRGTLSDVGGPTANMYGLRCGNPAAEKVCRRGSCLYPTLCKNLQTDERPAVRLLGKIRERQRVNHVFVASGVRYDLLPFQPQYFDDLLKHHVGGLLKVAPESTVDRVTDVMRKPGAKIFTDFLDKFRQRSAQLGLRQAIVPYLISGHPGCTLADMVEVALYLKLHRLRVEQVQDFTPTPGSLATCIYHTGTDPFSGAPIHVPLSTKEKRLQKALLLYHKPESKQDVLEALRLCGRGDAQQQLFSETRDQKAAGVKRTETSKTRRASRK
ncbi:YgiQ family radical SAM protein [Geopsychrobacter electrodiphilus]|uniref:YgiQ family radical SAM protein n=1 Tax=Geopsychrobacter electrodiphilus TaxID=225196 RepID=UPI000364BAD6|nr:YgiQ family radical SAM protein [Geopsychrobacter electrodiphilus]